MNSILTTRSLGIVSMNKLLIVLTLIAALGFSGAVHAAAISGQGTWESTLQGRDLDGNPATLEAYYDTVLDITWLADANYAGTRMNWAMANTWAVNLNPYGSGITGWRLPTTVDVGNDGATYTNYYQGVDTGYNITTHGEMSYLFYETLGNTAYHDTSGNAAQLGWGLSNTGPFFNVQSNDYWSATEYAPDTYKAWVFGFYDGYQLNVNKTYNLYAWAVHAGDVGVSTVPVPAAVWLFGSGLLGLIGITRRRLGTV